MATKPKGGAVVRYATMAELGASLAERLGKRPGTILVGNYVFPVGPDGLVDGTAVFEAAGAPAGKEPYNWARARGARRKIAAVAGILNLHDVQVFRAGRGQRARTHLHWHLALAYAEFLDPRQHLLVHLAYAAQVEELEDPGLKLDRALVAYRREGREDDWIEARSRGKPVRRSLAGVMAARGAVPNTFVAVSEIGNVKILGKPARLLRAARGPKGGSTRDGFSAHELYSTAFFESQLELALIRGPAYGHEEIVRKAIGVGNIVRQAIEEIGRQAGQSLAVAS